MAEDGYRNTFLIGRLLTLFSFFSSFFFSQAMQPRILSAAEIQIFVDTAVLLISLGKR